jgi:two-component system phosphate regulon sensor histidine kinase PhoR
MSSRTAYPWFFFYRIARLTLVVFLPTLFVILFLYRSSYRTGLVTQITQQTNEDLRLLDHTLRSAGLGWRAWCKALPPLRDVHYTLLRPSGEVLCDNAAARTPQPGPGATDDVAEALRTTFAFRLRKSPVFGSEAVFAAYRISDDLVVRKVVPMFSLRDNINRFDRVLFLRIVPFALGSYLLFIFLFFRSTKPLGVILTKVEKFKDDIPFNRNLALLYERDEWGAIEEALNKADLRLQKQILEVQVENEKNTAILESINDDIIAVDRYETILFYNSKFRNDFMNRREGSEIIKKVWHVFADEVLAAFREVLRAGEPRSLKGMSFPQSNRPERLFDLTITPLKSVTGVVNGALGVFYDVTEFKLAEQMRVDFVANVSHEIRTPLTSIKGFTQILQTQAPKIDPVLHPFLEKIVANTERMISLFNDLLNLSVIESKNTLAAEDVPLEEIVASVADNIAASYPTKRISVVPELRLPYVRGDFRLIEQVILNLCDNACKYAGDAVDIGVASFERDGRAYLVIRDNGPGIAREHLPRIFERFYRVDASRESLRGTGLGLSIVKQIVSKHRGRIWAESEGLGRGTAFVIELPLE